MFLNNLFGILRSPDEAPTGGGSTEAPPVEAPPAAPGPSGDKKVTGQPPGATQGDKPTKSPQITDDYEFDHSGKKVKLGDLRRAYDRYHQLRPAFDRQKSEHAQAKAEAEEWRLVRQILSQNPELMKTVEGLLSAPGTSPKPNAQPRDGDPGRERDIDQDVLRTLGKFGLDQDVLMEQAAERTMERLQTRLNVQLADDEQAKVLEGALRKMEDAEDLGKSLDLPEAIGQSMFDFIASGYANLRKASNPPPPKKNAPQMGGKGGGTEPSKTPESGEAPPEVLRDPQKRRNYALDLMRRLAGKSPGA